MPGPAFRELFDIATDQYGYVTQSDASDAGFSETVLRDMAKHGNLHRVGWGLYRFVSIPPSAFDQYMEASLWSRPSEGVLSHETALELYELCDVSPHNIHLTVPKRFRTRRAAPDVVTLHRRDLDQHEVTKFEGIPTVTVKRAILDGVDAKLRKGLLEQALNTARRRALLSSVDARELKKYIDQA